MAQKFKIDDEYLEVEGYGNTYQVRYPSHPEILDYQSKLVGLAEEDSKASSEVLFAFVEKLGLPREVIEKMPAKSLLALLKMLTDHEKKA